MRKILFAFFILTVYSCQKEIRTDLQIISPKYYSSEKSFVETIEIGDSINVGYELQQKSNLLKSSTNNALVIDIYFKGEQTLDESEIENFTRKLNDKKNGIYNLQQFDFVKYNIYNNGKRTHIVEEVISK